MKKILFNLVIINLLSTAAFSQTEDNILLHQKDSALPMIKTEQTKNIKELNLSTKQKKKIKKYHKGNRTKKAAIKKNTSSKDQQKQKDLAQLRHEKEAKLQAILTAEQKEKMKQSKDNKPRRGVTNMPNERTVK